LFAACLGACDFYWYRFASGERVSVDRETTSSTLISVGGSLWVLGVAVAVAGGFLITADWHGRAPGAPRPISGMFGYLLILGGVVFAIAAIVR
jgi:hypothetical protein